MRELSKVSVSKLLLSPLDSGIAIQDKIKSDPWRLFNGYAPELIKERVNYRAYS